MFTEPVRLGRHDQDRRVTASDGGDTTISAPRFRSAASTVVVEQPGGRVVNISGGDGLRVHGACRSGLGEHDPTAELTASDGAAGDGFGTRFRSRQHGGGRAPAHRSARGRTYSAGPPAAGPRPQSTVTTTDRRVHRLRWRGNEFSAPRFRSAAARCGRGVNATVSGNSGQGAAYASSSPASLGPT